MERHRVGMTEMLGGALHEDESTRGAGEMRDADKVVYRGVSELLA